MNLQEKNELLPILEMIEQLNNIGNGETLTKEEIDIINEGAFQLDSTSRMINNLINSRALKYHFARIQLALSPNLTGDLRINILGAFQEVFNNIKNEKEALKLMQKYIIGHLDYYCLNLGPTWETLLSIAKLSDADNNMLYNTIMQLSHFTYIGTSQYNEEERQSLKLDIQCFNEDVKMAERARKRQK